MSRILALFVILSSLTFSSLTFNAGAQHQRSILKNLSAASHTLPAQASANDSMYTQLNGAKCKTTRSGQEYLIQSCPGVGGYKLSVSEDDARMSVTVVDSRGKEHPLEYWNVITSGFSSLGDKAEWRVKKQKGKIIPFALIVRVNASENPEDASKKTSYLAVAKITPGQICVTDKIAPSATANEEARRAADASSSKPCLKQ
jgi:hypothetical protein